MTLTPVARALEAAARVMAPLGEEDEMVITLSRPERVPMWTLWREEAAATIAAFLNALPDVETGLGEMRFDPRHNDGTVMRAGPRTMRALAAAVARAAEDGA